MNIVVKVIMGVVIFTFILGFGVMQPTNNKKAPAGFITPKLQDKRSTEQRWQDAYEWQKERKDKR